MNGPNAHSTEDKITKNIVSLLQLPKTTEHCSFLQASLKHYKILELLGANFSSGLTHICCSSKYLRQQDGVGLTKEKVSAHVLGSDQCSGVAYQCSFASF